MGLECLPSSNRRGAGVHLHRCIAYRMHLWPLRGLKLQAVFGKDSATMFELAGIIGKHLS